MRKERRHARESSTERRNALQIVVVQIEVVATHLSCESSVAVCGIELLAKMTASLAERVLGHGLPEISFGERLAMVSSSERAVDSAGNDADFVYLFGNKVVDGIP